MSSLPSEYRFASEAQWNTGLARRLAWCGEGLRVSSAFATHAEPVGADARTGPLAAAPDGAIYWVEYPQTLRWRHRHGEQSGAIEVPPEIAAAPRLIAGRRWLWTHDAERAELYRFAIDTLTGPERFDLRERLALDAPCEELEIVDIASDGCEGLWVLLLESLKPLQLLRITERGAVRSAGDLPYCDGLPTAIAAVKNEVAVLHRDTQRLLFVSDRDFSATAEIALATLATDYQCTALGGDGRTVVALGGTLAGRLGRSTQIDVLRRTASGVDRLSVRYLPSAGASGVQALAPRREELWVSTASGVRRFGPATPNDPDEPHALYLTPVMISPPTGAQRGWLRADLEVDLPLGTRVTLGYASTSDQKVHDDVLAIAGQSDLSADQRIAKIDAKLGGFLTTTAIEFDGEAIDDDRRAVSIPLSRPMGNAPGVNTDIWMWVLIGLTSGAAGPLPTLRRLRVFYPFASIMEHLPAIFSGEGQVNGFMLDVVGILETTTQRLDAEIGDLARTMDPRHAPARWLDQLAGWLGVPWDTGLSEAQKRTILEKAPALLAGRGTRAALVTFLECLFPGARCEIFDQSGEREPARLGGATCAGASLPAVLAGWPRGLTVLADKAVLGCAHLPCGGEVADAPPPSVLRVEIAATPAEQSATPLATVRSLLAAVVPVECELCVRWRRPSGVGPRVEADGTLVLDGPAPVRVGGNLEIGYAVLGGHDRATLGAAGLSTEERLQ